MPSWSPPHRAMSQAMRGLANHRSVHDVRGLSRILSRTGTRPFWHGGAASSSSCASGSGGGAASSGSCTTASGWPGCASATERGLTWLGGGTWRSAVAVAIGRSDLALNDLSTIPPSSRWTLVTCISSMRAFHRRSCSRTKAQGLPRTIDLSSASRRP